MKRCVVVTGRGAVTPHGDLRATIDALARGASAIRPVTTFEGSPFGQPLGGECLDFDARVWFANPKALKLADRRTRLTVAAAEMARRDAAVSADDARDAAVIIGTSGTDLQAEDLGRAIGATEEGDANDIDYFGGRILRRLNPLWLLVGLANMASAHVAIQLGAHGPNSTVTTDWAAGLQAIGEAARLIAEGEADVAIAGGSDCGVIPLVYAALDASGFFRRGTFVPAEGAAMFVLEERDHAQRRGAAILGEVIGFSSASGPGALPKVVQRALARAGDPAIDVLCNGSYDATTAAEEDEAMRVSGSAPARLDPTSSMGHAFAAAAPISLAVALDSSTRRTVLTNAIGAAGQVASLVLRTGDLS